MNPCANCWHGRAWHHRIVGVWRYTKRHRRPCNFGIPANSAIKLPRCKCADYKPLPARTEN